MAWVFIEVALTLDIDGVTEKLSSAPGRARDRLQTADVSAAEAYPECSGQS